MIHSPIAVVLLLALVVVGLLGGCDGAGGDSRPGTARASRTVGKPPRFRETHRSRGRQVNACGTNPCQNGGQCVPAAGNPGFSCVCLVGFTGALCNMDSNTLHTKQSNPFVRNGRGVFNRGGDDSGGGHQHKDMLTRLAKVETELAVRRAYDTVAGLVGRAMSKQAQTDNSNGGGAAVASPDTTSMSSSSSQTLAATVPSAGGGGAVAPAAAAAAAAAAKAPAKSTTSIVGPPPPVAATQAAVNKVAKQLLVGIGRHAPDYMYPRNPTKRKKRKFYRREDDEQSGGLPRIAPVPRNTAVDKAHDAAEAAAAAAEDAAAAAAATPDTPDASVAGFTSNNVFVGWHNTPAKDTVAVIIPGETHEDVYDKVEVPPNTVTDPQVLDNMEGISKEDEKNIKDIHQEIKAIRRYIPHHIHVKGPIVN